MNRPVTRVGQSYPLKRYLTTMLLMLPALWASKCFEPQIPDFRKEATQLPPITQEGKNTFGCMLNGKLFVAEDRYAHKNPTPIYPPAGIRAFGLMVMMYLIHMTLLCYFPIISCNQIG